MQRDPNQVGMVYEVVEGAYHGTHKEHRTRVGDILLCVEHTGDCHYTWARLAEDSGNDETRYFQIETLYSSYVLVEEHEALKTGAPFCKRLLEIPLTDTQIKRALVSMHFNGRAAVLVPRPKDEVEKLRDKPCFMCGLKKSDVVQKPEDPTDPIPFAFNPPIV